MGHVLEARGLVKAFEKVRAVDGVDLTVGAGERVALLGPNGAGKTTTLLMLLGAITPDEGSITVVGHDLPKGRSRRWSQVGFVAGYLPLPDRLRVREALSIFAGFYGMGRKAGEAAVDKGLERFRITHLADRMCMELSSGQRTLVGIVKAILHDPELLVLDEPTASLDPDVAYRVRTGLLDVAANDGTALLVTSHNMREVERLCERVVFLAAGKIVADGSPTEVADAFGHGDLEGVFLHLAGTVVSEDEDPRPQAPVSPGGSVAANTASPARRPPPRCGSAHGGNVARRRSPVTVTPTSADRSAFSWLRVRTVVRRHGYVLFRSPHRWFDIAFWPVFDVLLLGSLGTFVAQQNDTSQARRRTSWPGSCCSTSSSRARSRWPPGSWRRRGPATSST